MGFDLKVVPTSPPLSSPSQAPSYGGGSTLQCCGRAGPALPPLRVPAPATPSASPAPCPCRFRPAARSSLQLPPQLLHHDESSRVQPLPHVLRRGSLCPTVMSASCLACL
ncbi:hypothetical protein BRADI_3g07563v3 [Brachypodium distachyon]|uniref:Uncharacterized protein n=1 Tax=Brachypodium distachyon TaxID=15368 RepID=A0A0Q3PWX4_BRADI|nr:hypothetical protein BRADI_3g07563v3 [Brachypodium distachyon]